MKRREERKKVQPVKIRKSNEVQWEELGSDI